MPKNKNITIFLIVSALCIGLCTGCGTVPTKETKSAVESHEEVRSGEESGRTGWFEDPANVLTEDVVRDLWKAIDSADEVTESSFADRGIEDTYSVYAPIDEDRWASIDIIRYDDGSFVAEATYVQSVQPRGEGMAVGYDYKELAGPELDAWINDALQTFSENK